MLRQYTLLAPPGLEGSSAFAQTQGSPQIPQAQYRHTLGVPPPLPPPSWHTPVNHAGAGYGYQYPNVHQPIGSAQFGSFAHVQSATASTSLDSYQQWYHPPPATLDPSRPVNTPLRKRKRQRVKRSLHAGGSTYAPQVAPSPSYQSKRNSKKKGWKSQGRSKSKSKDPDLFVHPKYFLAARSVGSSAEDIERWIAERRKNFPSSKRNPSTDSPSMSSIKAPTYVDAFAATGREIETKQADAESEKCPTPDENAPAINHVVF